MFKNSTLLLFSFLLLVAIPGKSQSAWDTLPSVPEDLVFTTATVLNGQIHLIGGGASGGATAKHYVYDTLSMQWDTLAPAPYKAQMPAAAVAKGKIHYFGGGFPNSGSPLPWHYIYDPDSNAWDSSTNLSWPRAIHYGATINDEAHVFAGQGNAYTFERFDDSSQAWVALQVLPDPYFMYGAHAVQNNKLYRFGGGGYTSPVDSAHVYDPASNTWASLPKLNNGLHGTAGGVIGERIYIVGGYYNFAPTDEVWIYDIASQTYSPGPTLPIGRDYHNVVSIGNCIYSIGGDHPIDGTVGTSFIKYCEVATDRIQEESLQKITAFYSFDQFHLDVPADFSGKKLHVRILTAAGKELTSNSIAQAAGKRHSISVPGLSSGIYIVEVSDQHSRTAKKIIKL